VYSTLRDAILHGGYAPGARLPGYVEVEAISPAEALEVLAHDRSIALVLSEVRLPAPSDGVTFIHTVKRRHVDPDLSPRHTRVAVELIKRSSVAKIGHRAAARPCAGARGGPLPPPGADGA
jgi:CheY-like chemotaxis protein